jgi:hypothetical protein
VTGGGGLAGIDVADDHEGHVNLILTHLVEAFVLRNNNK